MIRGITVSVGYDDLLAITLPRNLNHLDEVLVVTHPSDEATKAVASQYDNVRIYETTSFYHDGADFNKGLAMEEGFDVLGRQGWIVIFDADILFPKSMPVEDIRKGNLYTPRRRILDKPIQWHEGIDWSKVTLHYEREFAGYFQLFHADDQALRQKPWYGLNWRHAGGSDSVFQAKWPSMSKIRPPFEVLHLGPANMNWHGRRSPRLGP